MPVVDEGIYVMKLPLLFTSPRNRMRQKQGQNLSRREVGVMADPVHGI